MDDLDGCWVIVLLFVNFVVFGLKTRHPRPLRVEESVQSTKSPMGFPKKSDEFQVPTISRGTILKCVMVGSQKIEYPMLGYWFWDTKIPESQYIWQMYATLMSGYEAKNLQKLQYPKV